MCIVPIPGSVHWHTQYKMIPNITVHHKYNEYDPEFTLFIQVHSRKRIQGRSPSFKCAIGEQSLSGVSQPITITYKLYNLQHERLQPRMVNTLNVLASVT